MILSVSDDSLDRKRVVNPAFGAVSDTKGHAPTIIAVVGSYNLDTSIEISAFPVPGETILATSAHKAHGGKGSNQAIQAARLGGHVSMIACVGDDPAGHAAMDSWRIENVDVTGVSINHALPTGTAMILVDKHGENIIVVNAGANNAVGPAGTVRTLAALKSPPTILATQLETPAAVAQAAFRWAREEHVVTLLNAAPLREPLATALIALTDVLVVNEVEALALVGFSLDERDPLAAAQRLASQVGTAVVLTCGALGAILLRPGFDNFHVPSPATEVRDTTGAGDAFIGAFAYQLSSSGDLEAATRWGVAAGSFACRGHGAVPSYGSRAEIQSVLADIA